MSDRKRERNGEEPKMLRDRILELKDKYFNLVWYARSHPCPDHPEIEKVRRQNVEEVCAAFPREVEALDDDHSNWQHGFNSGALAILRLLLPYTLPDDGPRCKIDGIRTAEEEFPMLYP